MRFDPPLVEGTFLSRPNRFLAHVEIGGRCVPAHVHDPGRLLELLRPGARVLLQPAAGARKTSHDVMLVRKGEVWVAIYSTLANRLVKEALAAGELPELPAYERFECEVRDGRSRIDFRLGGPRYTWLEVKSATLVEEGTARFPDAPTERGRRHLDHLAALARQGTRAVLLFVVPRSDAVALSANRATDPDFAAALARAHASGVEILARNCRVGPGQIELGCPIPVGLD